MILEHTYVTVYYPCNCIGLRAVRKDDKATLNLVGEERALSEPFMCDRCRGIRASRELAKLAKAGKL